MIFADSVAYPFRIGFSEVYSALRRGRAHRRRVFIGAGKLGIPENAVVAFALGVDMVNVGREAMMSIGCIQAQKCHTDHCPVGVATQNPRYTRGLDPASKSVRGAPTTSGPCAATCSRSPRPSGSSHPALITADDVDILDGDRGGASAARRSTATTPGWGAPRPATSRERDRARSWSAPATRPPTDEARRSRSDRRTTSGRRRVSSTRERPRPSCRGASGRCRRARRGTSRPSAATSFCDDRLAHRPHPPGRAPSASAR